MVPKSFNEVLAAMGPFMCYLRTAMTVGMFGSRYYKGVHGYEGVGVSNFQRMARMVNTIDGNQF